MNSPKINPSQTSEVFLSIFIADSYFTKYFFILYKSTLRTTRTSDYLVDHLGFSLHLVSQFCCTVDPTVQPSVIESLLLLPPSYVYTRSPKQTQMSTYL